MPASGICVTGTVRIQSQRHLIYAVTLVLQLLCRACMKVFEIPCKRRYVSCHPYTLEIVLVYSVVGRCHIISIPLEAVEHRVHIHFKSPSGIMRQMCIFSLQRIHFMERLAESKHGIGAYLYRMRHTTGQLIVATVD